jgi:CHAT domain-containing protein
MATGKLTASSGAGGERGFGVDGAPKPAAAPALPGWTHPYYWAPFVLLGNGR